MKKIILILVAVVAVFAITALYYFRSEIAGMFYTIEFSEVKDAIQVSNEAAQDVTGDIREAEKAAETLEQFFELLHEGEYGEAMKIFKPSGREWEMVLSVSPEKDRINSAKVMKNYCEVMESCLETKVLQTEKLDDGRFKITTQFIEDNGEIYLLGPCCAETGPPVDTFEYYVENVNGEMKVTTIPQFHP